MSVFYRLDALNDNMNDGTARKTGLYPRVIPHRTVFLDELITQAVRNTTLNPYEARAAFDHIIDRLLHELENGNNVNIDNFGLFSLTATTKKEEAVQDEKDVRSASIGVKSVTFRMSKSLPKRLGPVDFMRLPWDSPKRKKK